MPLQLASDPLERDSTLSLSDFVYRCTLLEQYTEDSVLAATGVLIGNEKVQKIVTRIT